MEITRRNFIQKLSLAAVTTLALSPFAKVIGQETDKFFAIPSESANDPLSYLTSRHFEYFVNTSMSVRASNKRVVQLRLIEVKELKRAANQARGFNGESFSLLFQSSEPLDLPQDIYTFEHSSIGEFSLFLVPTGLKGMHYEAIINRISR